MWLPPKKSKRMLSRRIINIIGDGGIFPDGGGSSRWDRELKDIDQGAIAGLLAHFAGVHQVHLMHRGDNRRTRCGKFPQHMHRGA